MFIVLSTDIFFIEAHNHKTIVHTSEGDYPSVHNINYWLNELHMPCFFQSHRSFIVNLDHVSSFDRSLIYLCNNQYRAYLTRRKYTQFKDAFLLYLESRRWFYWKIFYYISLFLLQRRSSVIIILTVYSLQKFLMYCRLLLSLLVTGFCIYVLSLIFSHSMVLLLYW